MKQLLCMLTLICCLHAQAQSNKNKSVRRESERADSAVSTSIFPPLSPTTETEYRYMKFGYRQAMESGLDLKAGYTIRELQQYQVGKVTIRFMLFKRADGSLAGTILKTVSEEDFGSGTNYYAIPAPNSPNGESFGWANFYSDLNSMTCGMKTHVLNYLTYNFSSEQGLRW